MSNGSAGNGPDGRGADTNGDAQERATIRLVSEQIKGLRDMTELGFTNLQRQMDLVAGLPVAVARLRAEHDALTRRVSEIEGEEHESVSWKKVTLPVLILLLAGTIVSILALVSSVH